jgi:hypothetical protein
MGVCTWNLATALTLPGAQQGALYPLGGLGGLG